MDPSHSDKKTQEQKDIEALKEYAKGLQAEIDQAVKMNDALNNLVYIGARVLNSIYSGRGGSFTEINHAAAVETAYEVSQGYLQRCTQGLISRKRSTESVDALAKE